MSFGHLTVIFGVLALADSAPLRFSVAAIPWILLNNPSFVFF
jgi:hypothetical protein